MPLQLEPTLNFDFSLSPTVPDVWLGPQKKLNGFQISFATFNKDMGSQVSNNYSWVHGVAIVSTIKSEASLQNKWQIPFRKWRSNKSPRPNNRCKYYAKLGCASGLIFSLVIAHVRVPKYARSMERGLAFESHLDTL